MLRRLWDKALSLVESEPPPAATPTPRVGLSTTLLVVPWLFVLPLPMSSAVRFNTGLSMTWSLVVATVLSIALLIVWWPVRDRRPQSFHLWLAGLAWLALVCWWALAIYYDPRVYGMPSTGGIDPVGHLMEAQTFITDSPNIYWGMNGFHAVSHWLNQAGLDYFHAFRLIIYGMLLSPLIFVALIQASLAADLSAAGSSPRPVWIIAAMSVLVGFYPAVGFVLPVFHGYQLAGFWPHMFGLLPLFAGVLFYSVARFRLLRFLGLAICILGVRYTYFLNIMDLFATCALVLAWEAFNAEPERRRRRFLFGLALSGLLIAGAAYALLNNITDNGGGIAAPNIVPRLVGTGGLGVLLLCLPFLMRRIARYQPRPAFVRLAVFVGLNAVISTLVQTVWAMGVFSRKHDSNDLYLLYKYGFAPSVLVVVTAVPLLAYAITMALGSARPAILLRRLAVASAVTVAGLSLIHAQARSLPNLYHHTMLNRATEESRYMVSVADLDAFARIRRILAATGKRFGAFLTPTHVETQFAGYSLRTIEDPDRLPILDGSTGLAPSLDFQLLDFIQPDTCVFWIEPRLFAHIETWEGRDFERRQAVERLDRESKACVRYHRRSSPAPSIQLCYTCFAGSSSSLLPDSESTTDASGFYPPEKNNYPTNGKATLRLNRRLGKDCLLRIAAADADYSVALNDVILTPSSPGQFPIPVEAVADREAHLITISSTRLESDRGPEGVVLRDLVLSCISKSAPSLDRAGPRNATDPAPADSAE